MSAARRQGGEKGPCFLIHAPGMNTISLGATPWVPLVTGLKILFWSAKATATTAARRRRRVMIVLVCDDGDFPSEET